MTVEQLRGLRSGKGMGCISPTRMVPMQSPKKLGSTIVLLGTVTAAQTFDLSSYDGYKTFALGTNIIGYVSGSYNADTGVLTVNASRVSGSVTVSGYGWVEDSGHHRTGNGEMTGTASLNYPKQVFLVY